MKFSGTARRMLLPLALVIVIATGWSLYWYIASEKAKQSFTDYLEKNRATGVDIVCAHPVWGGFPFRFELTCDRLGAAGLRAGVQVDFAGGKTNAVALAYNPFHLIVEISGPVSLTVIGRTGYQTHIASNGKPLRTSLKLKTQPTRADQVSVLAQNLSGTITQTPIPGGASETVPFSVERLNLHTRFTAPPIDDIAPFDVAADVSGFVYGPDASKLFGTEPLRIETASMTANITSLPIAKGLTFATRTRQWHDQKGVLSVKEFTFTSNFLTGASSGDVNLDSKGLLNGRLEGSVSGFDAFLKRLETAGVIKENHAAIADTLMSVLGKPKQSPADASINVRTTFKQGKVYIGPFKVVTVPPLF